MTYTTGGLIQATDYNNFANDAANNVGRIWSTGSGDIGYGQTAISNVAVGGEVTAVQWATLVNALASMGSHQGTTITSRAAPVAGNVIAVLNDIATDTNSLTAARGNAATSGTEVGTFTGTTSKTTGTGSGTSSWTITFTHTVTFDSADAAGECRGAGRQFPARGRRTQHP